MSNLKDPSWLPVWWTRHWEPFMNVSHLHQARKGASSDFSWIFNYSGRKIAQFHCIHRRNGFQRHFLLSFHLKRHVRLSMWSFLKSNKTKELIRAHRKLKTRNERRRKEDLEQQTQTQAIKKRGLSNAKLHTFVIWLQTWEGSSTWGLRLFAFALKNHNLTFPTEICACFDKVSFTFAMQEAFGCEWRPCVVWIEARGMDWKCLTLMKENEEKSFH